MAYIINTSLTRRYRPDIQAIGSIETYRAYMKEHKVDTLTSGIEVPFGVPPQTFQIEDKRLPTHGFFNTPNGIAVDDRVVKAIEDREPGVHRFHPIEISMKDGRNLERPHFLLNCCTRVDAIDPDHSEVKMRMVIPGPPPRMESASKPFPEPPTDRWHYNPLGTLEGLSVFRDRIAGRAMWWDERLNRLFFSDEVVEALTEAGVKGLDLSPHVAEL